MGEGSDQSEKKSESPDVGSSGGLIVAVAEIAVEKKGQRIAGNANGLGDGLPEGMVAPKSCDVTAQSRTEYGLRTDSAQHHCRRTESHTLSHL
jgi:hypothetical protein